MRRIIVACHTLVLVPIYNTKCNMHGIQSDSTTLDKITIHTVTTSALNKLEIRPAVISYFFDVRQIEW